MSRYSRRDDDLAYGDPPGPQRWDRDRFAREGQRYRQAPVIEERPPYQASRAPAYYEDDRIYEEDYQRGPRGTRDRRYFEEDEYYDPRANSGAVIPFRPARPARPAGMPRPGMIRRQSSVDRIDFDRRTYRETDYRPPPPARPREGRSSRYDIRIYDDVKIQDPEYYGDEGFREYKEREWTRSRTRADDPSPNRRAPSERAPTEIVTAPGFEEQVIEEKTIIAEKPYPRRGKTRMPRRLVDTRCLDDMGYSFYFEDEKTVLIELALGPDNIDAVFARSKEYKERDVIQTNMIEPPPSAKSFYEAPRSVRDWDNMRPAPIDRSPSPGSSISQSTRKSRRRARSVHESIHEDDRYSRHGNSVHESYHKSVHRDASPATTHRSRKSRARSRAKSRATSISDDETIIEKKTIIREDNDESGTLDLNFPLSTALVQNRSKSRSDVEIREEILALERERRDLRREGEIIRYERGVSPVGRLMEPKPVGEIIIENARDGENVVSVRKDKRGRMSLVV